MSEVMSKTGKKNTHSLKQSVWLKKIPPDRFYHYEVLTEKHIPSVVKMFVLAFCDYEPMTEYVSMPYDAFTQFAQAVTRKAAQDGLSIVALNGDEAIACALVEDINQPLVIDFALHPKFDPIFSLLETLSKHLLSNQTFPNHHIAHLFITAVHPTYHHQGLSKQVNFRAMDLAARTGFSFMLSEFTNYYNELGVIPHLPYAKKLIGKQIYNQFNYNNEKPFLHLTGGANAYLWELQQNSPLTRVIKL